MKLNKYIWLAALPIAFTACQDDALVENPIGKGITTLTCTMEGGLPDSRAQIVFGGTSTSAEYFHWNAGDEFTLFEKGTTGDPIKKVFEIKDYSEETPSSNATFSVKEGTAGLTTNNTYVAYYTDCTNGLLINGDGTINFIAPLNYALTVTEEKSEEEAWKEYFQKNMHMKAFGTVGGSSLDTKLKFEHLCGLIRITYTNETEETIDVKSVILDGHWGEKIVLSNESTETEGITQVTDNNEGIKIELSGVSIAPNEAKDIYLLFFPPYGENPNPLTTIKIDGKDTPETYMGEEFSVSGFEAGQSYWFNVTNTGGETLEWTKELHTEDLVAPLERYMDCANFATLKAALASNIVEDITLTKDIALLAPIEVNHPVMLNLNGKKLTLGEGYTPDEKDAVFNITASSGGDINIANGDIECADGDAIQKYLFKLSGNNVNFHLADINISSGGTIPDIIYMDDDYLNIRSYKNDEEEIIETNITTTGNVIYGETNKSGYRYHSSININGELNGDFYFKSNNGYLAQGLTVEAGIINGNLIFAGVDNKYDTTEFFKYHYRNVTIGQSYTESWEQAKKFAEDQERTVSKLDDLIKYLNEPQILDETTIITFELLDENENNVPFTITLTEPLTITKKVMIDLNGNTLSIPTGFNWENSADAAITTESHLSINNGTVSGECASTTTGKYIFKATSPDHNMRIMGLTLNATGMNGVLVENSELNIDDYRYRKENIQVIKETDITVENDYYAIHAKSSTAPICVNLNSSGTLIGNIGYDLNYLNKEFLSRIFIDRGTVDGDLIASETGTYNKYLEINYGENFVIPNGWPVRTPLDMMALYMELNGQFGRESLEVNKDITIVLDPSFENIRFDAKTLTGSGTITFQQSSISQKPQILQINISELSDDVDFKFEGNFQKTIFVGSTQIQKVMNWAKNQDEVSINLTGNVEIAQTLTSNGLTMIYGSKEVSPGSFNLNLNKWKITSAIEEPAIKWMGGVLKISNGTIETKHDAVQIGDVAGENNNGVVVAFKAANIASTSGRCVYFHSDENAQEGAAYKTAEVELLNNATLTSSSTGAIVLDANQYTLNSNAYVANNGGTITPEFTTK